MPLPVRAAVASITLSSNTLSFNIVDSTQQFMPAGSITVSGNLTVSANTGSAGSIQLLSPPDITGSSGGTLEIADFSLTCSGTAVAGQTFNAVRQPLTASAATPCATYATGFDTRKPPVAPLDFALSLFLDDRTLDNDSYPATNFTVVATAT